jgi:hypothetical protein
MSDRPIEKLETEFKEKVKKKKKKDGKFTRLDRTKSSSTGSTVSTGDAEAKTSETASAKPDTEPTKKRKREAVTAESIKAMTPENIALLEPEDIAGIMPRDVQALGVSNDQMMAFRNIRFEGSRYAKSTTSAVKESLDEGLDALKKVRGRIIFTTSSYKHYKGTGTEDLAFQAYLDANGWNVEDLVRLMLTDRDLRKYCTFNPPDSKSSDTLWKLSIKLSDYSGDRRHDRMFIGARVTREGVVVTHAGPGSPS